MLDFLGTFNKSQFERLAAYARAQLPLVSARIAHLSNELLRVGVLVMRRNEKQDPIGYMPSPPTSYLAKLLSAYEVLGGDPFFDLQIRSYTDPIYLLQGDEAISAKMLSSGEPWPERVLADAPSALLVGQIRGTMEDVIARREALERKIRRCLDYGDQITAEIEMLRKVRAASDTAGSLEAMIAEVLLLINDPTYRAVPDDKGRDPYGKLAKAPFSSFESGGDRDDEFAGPGATRENTGLVDNGEDV
jgi:hypothetical protein